MSFRARSYPHPVLSPYSRDYVDGSVFHGEFDRSSTDGELAISYHLELTSNRLDEFRMDKSARLALNIYAKGTRWKSVQVLNGLDGTVTIPEDLILGSIEVTPVLVATKDGELEFDGINGEYGTKRFTIQEGDLLALGPTEAMESDLQASSTDDENWIVFRLDQKLDPDEYKAEPAGDVILVSAGENIMQLTNAMRANPNLRPYLFMSIYKDAFVEAVEAILLRYANNDDLDEPWAKGLQQFIDSSGLPFDQLQHNDRQGIQSFVLKMLAKDGSGALVKKIQEGNVLA